VWTSLIIIIDTFKKFRLVMQQSIFLSLKVLEDRKIQNNFIRKEFQIGQTRVKEKLNGILLTLWFAAQIKFSLGLRVEQKKIHF